MLRKPTPLFLGSPSTDSYTCTSYSRLNFPFRKLNPSRLNFPFRELNPPNSLSFRFYKQSPAKIVTFSSNDGNQVIEDGSSVEQVLQTNSLADFLSFKRSSDGRSIGDLQTSVVSYKKRLPSSPFNPSLQVPVQVDLVSAIHIADKEYFTTLQKKLEAYDCVLYEAVASRKILEKKGKKFMAVKTSTSDGLNISGLFQRLLARILKLDFQLDCLGYELENWYHADLDYETFQQLQLEKGENFFTLFRHHASILVKDIFEHSQDLADSISDLKDSFSDLEDSISDLADLISDLADSISDLSDMIESSPDPEDTIEPSPDPEDTIEPSPVPDDLGTWKSKLLWDSRKFPVPLVIRHIIQSVCDPASYSSEYPGLAALSRLEFDVAMKIFLAKLITSLFTQVPGELEFEADSVIIGDRNKAACEALKMAVEEGHNRIAILYGCGHMPDMGRRLQEEFDLIPTQAQWITAWSIKKRVLDGSSGWPLNWSRTVALPIVFVLVALELLFWGAAFALAVFIALLVMIYVLIRLASKIGGRIHAYLTQKFPAVKKLLLLCAGWLGKYIDWLLAYLE